MKKSFLKAAVLVVISALLTGCVNIFDLPDPETMSELASAIQSGLDEAESELKSLSEEVDWDGNNEKKFDVSEEDDHVFITDYDGSAKTLTIPAKIGEKPVKGINSDAFSDNEYLENVTISEGIELIDDRAFYGCLKLKSVKLPESAEYIGNEAFADCPKLAEINIPDNIKKADENAFEGCDNISVTYRGKTYAADNIDELFEDIAKNR